MDRRKPAIKEELSDALSEARAQHGPRESACLGDTEDSDRIWIPPEIMDADSFSVKATTEPATVVPPEHSAPWVTERVKGIAYAPLRVHNEIIEFSRLFGPTPADSMTRAAIGQRVAKAIKTGFPEFEDAKIAIYGSTAQGLYLPSSDIDITILGADIPESRVFINIARLKDHFQGLAWTADVEAINCSVPILKLTDRRTRINIDVSIGNTDGVKTIALIREHRRDMPELLHLLLVVKTLLRLKNFNETFSGGLSSLTLTVMIIRFLQAERMANYRPQLLSTLLIKFFKLHGDHFDYDSVGITIRGTGAYFLIEEKHFECQAGRLCVENPIDTSKDLGARCRDFHLIRDLFSKSYKELVWDPRTTPDGSVLARLFGKVPTSHRTL